MSLQDESFPHDELLDLDLSPTPLGRFQFPHRLRERQKQQEQQQQEHSFSGESNKSALLLVQNLSTSISSTGDQTISSAESANEQQPPNAVTATVDERMIKSDQTGMSTANHTHETADTLKDQPSFSFNNIHSEYTKRRYKHVESKVGQYIANIRNEDARRRKLSKYQRHNSLPEIPVHDPRAAINPMRLQRSATIVAEKLNRALVGVIDNVDEDDDEEEGAEDEDMRDGEERNTTATTTATISTQSSSGGSGIDKDQRHNVRQQRQTDESAESVWGTESKENNCIDTNVYALLLDERERLQSYTDYQQLKLDEKQSEITRLRQNVDFLRVRLSNAEDQLKKNTTCRSMTLNGGSIGGIFGGGYGHTTANWCAGRQSLQGLLYCAAKSTKATQTEMLQLTPTAVNPPTPPPPPPPLPSPTPLPLDIGLPSKGVPLLYVTPDTPDANNNMCGEVAVEGCARNMKTVATIQPMSLNFSNYVDADSAERRTTKDVATLRRRSNSLATRQRKHTQTNTHAPGTSTRDKSTHNSRSSHPSSSDSAIDVEVIDLSSSPKSTRRKRYTTDCSDFGNYEPKAPRRFPYRHDQRSPSPMGLYIERCPNSTTLDLSTVGEVQSSRKLLSKQATGFGGGSRGGERKSSKRFLSRRWLHLFGSCIRCTNPQQADHEQFGLQQTYTQVPLLESTFERSCVELRSQ